MEVDVLDDELRLADPAGTVHRLGQHGGGAGAQALMQGVEQVTPPGEVGVPQGQVADDRR
ncbi:hypothetical protein GCM10027614_01150 [Micromonospora vulcania]